MAGAMKRVKRMLCGLLSLLMLGLPCLLVSAAAEEAGQMPSEVPAQTEYFPYYDANARVPFLEESIRLSVASGETEGEAKAEADHLGKESVCLTGGAVTWKLSLPEKSRFVVKVTYVGDEGNYTESSVALSLDGEVPFEEAGSVRLTRLWKDAGGITQDSLGNDTIPEQEQVMVWNTVALQDHAIFSAEPLYFCLDAGEHTITLRSWSKEPLHIAGIELIAPEEVPTDKAAMNAYSAAGYAPVAGYYKKLQAESPALKSTQSIYPTYDRSSPATEPYDAYNIRRNTIGDGNWSDPGSWVSYHIEDVPADGLYYITLKYRQHQVLGSSTFRTIRINGAVPSEAYRNVAFPYNVNWQNMTISGEDGALVPVYLQEGENEIRLEATVGKWAEVLRKVEASTQRLNDMYVQMVMITGTTPDKYFDYDLETEIPDLISCFTTERKVMLEMESADFVHWSQPQLLDFGDAPDIPLYTNVIQPYPYAPHTYVGFPSRYIERLHWTENFDELSGLEARELRYKEWPRYALAITDCVFITSRDGVHFKKYDEAFIRPSPENGRNWHYGGCYPARGFVETPADEPGAEPELSLFVKENSWSGIPVELRRYRIRKDGFVSLHAGAQEETVVTKPFVYDGSKLYANVESSAWGYLYFTLILPDGKRVESTEVFGNSTEKRIHFPEQDLACWRGQEVVLEVRMRDADLYAIRFE